MATPELDSAVEEFYHYYVQNFSLFERTAHYLTGLLRTLLSEECEIESIAYRIKDKEECINKFKRKYFEEVRRLGSPYRIDDYITDLLGVRIVCLYQNEIAKIQDILSRNFEFVHVNDKIKTLEETENQFGYKSLHIDLKLNGARRDEAAALGVSELPFEVQVRTIIQDAWSVLDHKIKYKRTISPDLARRINRLAALFEIADDEFQSIRLDTLEADAASVLHDTAAEPLTVPSFLSVAAEYFPTYQFIPYKADAFVTEIFGVGALVSQEYVRRSLHSHLETVKEYDRQIVQSSPANYLNPYTMIRHCLYLANPEVFHKLLFLIQKKSFNEWISSRPIPEP